MHPIPLSEWATHFCEKLQICHLEQKVCVVSIIGKDSFTFYSKAACLNAVTTKECFSRFSADESDDCLVNAYFDASLNVVFLILKSPEYLQLRSKNRSSSTSSSASAELTNAVSKVAQFTLLLFHISHIIIVTHPNHLFDISYVRYFRCLDEARENLRSELCERLSSKFPKLPKAWLQHARPCSPRVLFCFQRPPIKVDPERKRDPLRKLEQSMEDQIYRLLRSSRVITNNSSESLFAVPTRESYVYMQSEDEIMQNPINFLLEDMQKFCSESGYSSDHSESNRSYDALAFREFLSSHVDKAFSQGFDDNMGRNAVPAFFEMIRLKYFVKLVSELYECLIIRPKQAAYQPKWLKKLKEDLNIDGRFSQNRCAKVLPLAVTHYQEDSPPYYSSTQHQAKLTQALKILTTQARGPAVTEYASKLVAECESFWEKRRACEARSLTGHYCVNKVHATETEMGDFSLSIMKHTSQIRYVSTCNCGFRQAQRLDPFEIKEANYDFYKQSDFICCTAFQSVEFPVFNPSTPDAKAAQAVENMSRNAANLKTQSQDIEKGHSTSEEFLYDVSNKRVEESITDEEIKSVHESQLSQPDDDVKFDAKPEETETKTQEDAIVDVGLELKAEAMAADSPKEESQCEIIENKQSGIQPSKSIAEKNLIAVAASTVEYLPAMIHLNSKPGLLPTFPSWSLICLGPSSVYSHNHGLREMPNFTHGSGYLLMCDVQLKVDLQKWREQAESLPGTTKKRYSGKSVGSVNVKLFVGLEYECLRGHRFTLQAADRILKQPPGIGGPKDSYTALLHNDMPLWFPCPCRQSKPLLLAQLMRLHLVTPKAPVYVQLDPRVQPAPGGEIFYMGNSMPIRLSPSEYWLLRLPFAYVGDQSVYYPPQEAVPFGRLSKNAISIVPFD